MKQLVHGLTSPSWGTALAGLQTRRGTRWHPWVEEALLQGVKPQTSLSRTCVGEPVQSLQHFIMNLKPCTCITFVSLSQHESKARLIQLSGSWPAVSSKVVHNLVE